MQCDRAEPGLRAPSVDVENKAAALSPWVRTTLPVCQELPTLPVLAEKAAWVEFQVRVRLITRPTGTATGSTVRRARGARWCTATPPTMVGRDRLRPRHQWHRRHRPTSEEPGRSPHPIGWCTPAAPRPRRRAQD